MRFCFRPERNWSRRAEPESRRFGPVVAQASELKLTTQSVRALGSEAAQEIGTFMLKTRGQDPQEMAGKYVVIWQKVGSEWKIATDIWNTNK
jgi:ketosteroid isomerase-like protein